MGGNTPKVFFSLFFGEQKNLKIYGFLPMRSNFGSFFWTEKNGTFDGIRAKQISRAKVRDRSRGRGRVDRGVRWE